MALFGCPESDLGIYAELKYDAGPGRTDQVLWVSDCRRGGGIALVSIVGTTATQIDYIPGVVGAKVAVRRVSSESLGPLLVSVLEFEPNSVQPSFFLRVLRQDNNMVVLSASSTGEPRIDPSEPEQIVIFQDVFGIELPGAPTWPLIVGLRSGVRIEDIRSHSKVLRWSISETDAAISRLERDCRPGMDDLVCGAESIDGLRRQSRALQQLLLRGNNPTNR